MTMLSEHIRHEIRTIWPGVSLIQTPDIKYFIPDGIEQVMAALDELVFPENTPAWWDCNHYALQVHAYIHRTLLDDGAPWALGMAYGERFHGFPMNHTINIVRTQSGYYFYDRQNEKHWSADPMQDKILTVTM